MALKVKAKEQYQNIGKYAGKYRYVMMPELYTALAQDKVIKEAALRSGVALPGLGTMRFGLRAKSVEKVDEVKAGLISSRRIIFTPDVDLKEELAKTAVQITCFDRTGKEVKRVTSADDGTVEDNEQTPGSDTGSNTSNTGSDTGGDTQGGDNTGGGSTGDNGDRDPDGGTNSDE